MKYNAQYNEMATLPLCVETPETIGKQDVDPESYKCHPSIGDVVDEVMRLYNKYKIEEKPKEKKIFNNNKGKIKLSTTTTLKMS